MRSFILLIATTVSVQAQQTIRLSLGANVEMELVQIAPGKFTQGESSESQREVTVTQPFYIGKNPVTRGEFARFAAATNYRTESERGPSGGFGWEGGTLVQNKRYTWRTPGFPQADDHPVVMIDFSDAKAFCAWLSRQSGRTIALPTEAQWEYAARANWSATDAWHVGNSPTGTQPVGAKAPNGWGLYDMTGNAWEWCEDWFAPYTPAAAIDPLQKNPNLSDKPRRVLRGGAFSRPAAEATVGKRFRNDPGSRNADNGFRVVAFNAPPQPPPPAPAPVTLEHVQPPTPAPNRPATRDVPGALTIPNGQEQESYEAPHSSRGPGMLVWLAIAGALLVLWRVIKGISRSLTANPLRTSAPAPMREALVLRYVADLSHREIALACNLDEPTARKRISRALARLRSVMPEQEIE